MQPSSAPATARIRRVLPPVCVDETPRIKSMSLVYEEIYAYDFHFAVANTDLFICMDVCRVLMFKSSARRSTSLPFLCLIQHRGRGQQFKQICWPSLGSLQRGGSHRHEERLQRRAEERL